jgi:DNA-binding XRE family transcriptional regulator
MTPSQRWWSRMARPAPATGACSPGVPEIWSPQSHFERIFILPRKPNFARFIRDARLKRRLSVADVAEQIGVSTACVYFWEEDRTRPRDANLNALCKALKLPVRAMRELAAD